MTRLLPALALLAACAQEPAPMIVVYPDGTTETVEDCNRACNAPTPDETHLLTDEEFLEAVAEVAKAPIGQDTVGLDTLLFHFDQVPDLFAHHGDQGLSKEHRTWLDRELSRQTVDIGFRLVDTDGAVLGELAKMIPLKIKRHLALDGGPLKTIMVNGKTKRVGLHHLWSRW